MNVVVIHRGVAVVGVILTTAMFRMERVCVVNLS